MRIRDWRQYQATAPWRLSGGARLKVPRTPAQRVVLYAKLKRLKSDAEKRAAARARNP